MKNKIEKVIAVVVILLISIFCLNTYVNVKADSGWDTDYDSGGSWDSDSSWDTDYDSGSSWDSDSSGGGYSSGSSCTTEECKRNRRIIAIVGLISFGVITISAFLYAFIKATTRARIKMIKSILSFIMLIVVLYYSIFLSITEGPIALILIPISGIVAIIINSDKKEKIATTYPHTISNDSISNYHQITKEQANNVISNFNIEDFNFNAYQIFYDTQIAWMEFNYDKLKEILTDELYNTYEMDLEVLKTKNQKNIMKDFKLKQIKLIDLKETNEKYTAKVVLEVEFIDYIEDINDHKILRGTDRYNICNTYILTFERSKKDKIDNICPKCGAEVKGNTTGICEYCRAKLINDNYDWVMSQKEKINQK